MLADWHVLMDLFPVGYFAKVFTIACLSRIEEIRYFEKAIPL
jgi:hypothetical protein